MIFHICNNCKARIPAGMKCAKCSAKRYRQISNKREQVIYDTGRWQKLRDRARKYFFNLDLISYLNDNDIVYGEVVHHIVPVEMDPSLQYDFENLILISESRHRKIHKRMETEPDKVIAELKAERQRIVKHFNLPGG